MRRLLYGGMALGIVAGALRGTARGDASFTVSGAISYGGPTTFVREQYDVTSPVSVGRGVNDDVEAVQDFHAQADSLAEGFGLHAHAFVQVTHGISGESGGGTYDASAFAKSTFTDFVITGPVGATPVQTAIHFHMSGQQALGTHVPAPGIGGGGAASTISFFMQVDGSNDGGSLSLGASRGIPTAPNATGMLIGFNGNEDIATQAFMLPVNTPMALSLYLTAEASVSVDFQESFITSANTDFSGTLTFATDVPVFSLPPGYTVNSAQAGVIANTFAVPEAGTLGLLVVGLAGAWRRRR